MYLWVFVTVYIYIYILISSIRATTQYNDQKLALIEAEEEMQCLESRLSYARNHLHRLQRTNVLNIAFPIWYDGHIGVINGLHLGRLPNRPVSVLTIIIT